MIKIPLISWGIPIDGDVCTRDACEQIAAQAKGKLIQAPIPTPTAWWRIINTYPQETAYLPGTGVIIAECVPVPEDTPITDENHFVARLGSPDLHSSLQAERVWSVTP